MKKLMMIALVASAVVSAKAACVDWEMAGAAATQGYSVYLVTSLADSYESVSDIASAAVSSATINKSGRSYTTGVKTAVDDSITTTSMKNAYYILVADSSSTSYTYYKADLSAMVYDPNNQESSPGTFSSINAATALASGTSANFAAVPEPTSGLLMLLGVAGLALRRRRA